MSRWIDLIAVAAVAVVLLLPKPSIDAHVALDGEKIELDRIAALEDARYSEPDSPDRAVELADAYLSLLHADWALETTAQFATAGDHRISMARATAHAERLEAQACLDETRRGLMACDTEGAQKCPEAVRIRFGVISSAMQALVDSKVDPAKDPKRAREEVSKVLHSTKASDKGPTPKPTAPPKQPAQPAPAPKK
jgi:hypothetical protein